MAGEVTDDRLENLEALIRADCERARPGDTLAPDGHYSLAF